MAVPQSKVELLDAIGDSYCKLTRDLERLPPELARESTLPGHAAGTMMSPADLVAYLIGWNELVLSWFEIHARGDEPSFPAPGFTWNQLGELAQKFYSDHAAESWTGLLTRFAAAEEQVIALVESMSDDELYGAPFHRRYTAGRMIQFNTSSPYTNARRRIRAWLRERISMH
ncbi:ClbS/DfsB family four-helix bundle protein [Rhodococcus maanshanensis]|uniref:ClbS/DfsB family four-helix bundle protein n=1 Tax=Rhodococcus maanshanensis TaxID=183556 RepID=UPI0022B2D0C5|nr:ClbS/DfsB family four-helix bundle protein [Rhodococcus maanshanensis]MCZ4556796.1 ClbS/DfsB family four-helix bundle protein [Rhodococcus maanshanensis]